MMPCGQKGGAVYGTKLFNKKGVISKLEITPFFDLLKR